MSQRGRLAAGVLFSPDLGPLEHRLRRMAQDLVAETAVPVYLDRAAIVAHSEAVDRPGDQRLVRWAFCVSLLADIAAVGGKVFNFDSGIFVSWPDWSRPEAREHLRRALVRLRDESPRRVSAVALEQLTSVMSTSDLRAALRRGEFRLREATEGYPNSPCSVHEIFRALRQYWNMPDRDREGRSRRFVLTCRLPSGDRHVPVGILEASDGPPFSNSRDAFFGLTSDSFQEWLDGRTRAKTDLEKLVARFAGLRKALLPVRGVNSEQFANTYRRWRELDGRASGRSIDGERLDERKRLAYLIRLVRGEHALRAIGRGETADPSDLYAGVRVLQNLAIPRLHLEMSVCGAVPPFSVGLAGKLVASFFADPRVLSVCKSPPGIILRRIFDADKLQTFLPAQGAVYLTTLGLYPHHSAQYERAQLPGSDPATAVPLRRVGETSGETASLISRRTYDLAQRVLDAAEGARRIAGEFGAGGSKRQRRIEAAAQIVGLPEQLIHPRTPRPIYASSLVENPREVALLGSPPKWAVPVRITPSKYAERASAVWRRRWLATAERRIDALGVSEIGGMKEWAMTHGLVDD